MLIIVTVMYTISSYLGNHVRQALILYIYLFVNIY